MNLVELITAWVSRLRCIKAKLKREMEIVTKKKLLVPKRKTLKYRWKVKSKKKVTETSNIWGCFFCSNKWLWLREKDFTFGSSHPSLSDKMLTEKFNYNIKISNYVIDEYEGETCPWIVNSKIDKAVEVSTMVMRSPKKLELVISCLFIVLNVWSMNEKWFSI